MNNNFQSSNTNTRKETLLPPPELLERYEEVSKGLSKDLIDLVKAEQEHRHKLQDKYLMHFRLGQLFGAMFLLYSIYKITELAKAGNTVVAYTLSGIFGFLIVLILMQYKKDKLSAIIRNSKRNNIRRPNSYRKPYPSRRITN